MFFLNRTALFARNPLFAAFARDWQEKHYHPRNSLYAPGPAIIRGREEILDEAGCEVLNAELMEEFKAMQDQIPQNQQEDKVITLPDNLLQSGVMSTLSDQEKSIAALCKGLSHGLQFLNWRELLLISLYPAGPIFEANNNYPPYAKARNHFEALGMPKAFGGGIQMARHEVQPHLPYLIQAVLVSALPLALTAPGEVGSFLLISDRCQFLGYFADEEQQQLFQSAMRAGGLLRI